HRDYLLPARDVIASATQIGSGLLLPTIRHRILHNVIHAQIENGDWVGGVLNLRDTLDLARLVARCDSDFDWPSLGDQARERWFFRYVSGAIHCAHRVLQAPLPRPFANDVVGRLHAWRCVHQRRFTLMSKVLERSGVVARALAWERDAYPLKLKTRSL